MSKSNAESVCEFTSGTGSDCPDKPTSMSRDSVKFIIRMVISELDELACTVTETPEDRDEFMQECLDTRDPCKKFKQEYSTDTDLISSQFDALVDSWYYSLNIAAKHGVNMSKMFDIVHNANMAKRDPETGKFLRRESDGKVIKPKGWKPPNVEAEIERQMTEGSWVRYGIPAQSTQILEDRQG